MSYLGWIGMAMLLSAYVLLNTRVSKYFTHIACIASIVLTIHAIAIKDIPFIIVNGFVAGMLLLKTIRGGVR